MAKSSQKKRPASRQLSDRTKKLLAIGSGSALVLVGAWWAYFRFTTVPPPDLQSPEIAQKPERVVEFLGQERGFARMSTPRQEAYLLSAYQVYGRNNPEARGRFIQAMQQMSSSEHEVLSNAIFDIGRGHVMEHAREYASLPPSQRAQYLEGAYGNFEKMRTELSGQNAGENLSSPLQKDVPTSSDEMMKAVVDRTSSRERAEAKPFIDAMATKAKEKEKTKAKGR